MTARTLAANVPDTALAAPGVSGVLQRACDCGGAAGLSGQCAECAAEEQLGVQPKLTIGAPDDPYEQEADRTADQVISGTGPGSAAPLRRMPEEVVLQTKSDQLQPESLQRQPVRKEDIVQLKAAAHSSPAPCAPAAAAAAAFGGQSLSHSERTYFEPRFGRDLSHVRLHTDASAARAAAGINALAYTLRNHIVFASGQYAPRTLEGRRLIAHELTHTLQQDSGQTLRRTCPTDPTQIPAGGSAEFEQAVDDIRALDAYQDLAARASTKADHIIDGARGSLCPMFYITQLRVLFDTQVNPPAQTASEMRKRSIDATAAEQKRLADPYWATLTNVEEEATASASRRWRTDTGEGGTQFRIDDDDPASIYIQMKVWPRARGSGNADDVARTVGLVDGIETAALTQGYLLDIDFVTRGGPDVFEVGVDPSQWVTSGNWVGGPGPLAHEAHHLLGLEDRYNYLSHTRNENMQLSSRLHWFREQMVRASDPMSPHSMMRSSSSGSALNEEDVCALAAGDFRGCLVTRFALRPASDIEALATDLSHPYRPQHAALLHVMSEAWERRPFPETTASCSPDDPICGLPPISAFGDSNIVAMDENRFPLANPHNQPAGSTLSRTARSAP